MITEDYVSFDVAKLLKEKGFDAECAYLYIDGKLVKAQGYACNWNDGETLFADYKNECSAPTLQMAMKWLRKKQNQNVTVKAYNNVARLKTIYYAEVQNLSEPTEKGFCVNGCTFKDTYEEACESAIRYILENLI
jgi:hypothetical protein